MQCQGPIVSIRKRRILVVVVRVVVVVVVVLEEVGTWNGNESGYNIW